MNYLNLEIARLRSAEFIGSEPVDRATWLALMTFCAVQENGGWIADCGEWGERKWQQLVGVTLDEIRGVCQLWKWSTDDNGGLHVIVWGYPHDKEMVIREKRSAGQKGGSASTPVKSASAKVNGQNGGRPRVNQEEPKQKPKQHAGHNPSENPTEGKGREGKEKEEKNTDPPPAPQKPSSVSFSSEEMGKLHESFCALTGNAVDLTPQRQRSWTDFVRRGFTESDFKRVVFWIRQRMNASEGGLSEQSLTFRVLIGDVDKFEERLHLAKKTGLAAGPTLPAKEPPDWREWALTKYPGARLPGNFWALEGSVQREFREERPELGWKGANFIGL